MLGGDLLRPKLIAIGRRSSSWRKPEADGHGLGSIRAWRLMFFSAGSVRHAICFFFKVGELLGNFIMHRMRAATMATKLVFVWMEFRNRSGRVSVIDFFSMSATSIGCKQVRYVWLFV